MKIYASLFVLFSILNYGFAAKRKPQGKVRYEMNWVGGFVDCENFQNTQYDASKLKIVKDSPTSTSLSGEIILNAPLIEETTILIVVDKETPQGKVLAYTLEIENVCNHVKEEGMPWSIFFDAMKLDPKECPIPAKSYSVNGVKLSLAFVEKALNHETVGEYGARIEFLHRGSGLDVVEHVIACYQIGFKVDEVRD